MSVKISRIDLLTPMIVTYNSNKIFLYVDFVSELIYNKNGEELNNKDLSNEIIKIIRNKKNQGIMSNLAPDIQDKYQAAMKEYRKGIKNGSVKIKNGIEFEKK